MARRNYSKIDEQKDDISNKEAVIALVPFFISFIIGIVFFILYKKFNIEVFYFIGKPFFYFGLPFIVIGGLIIILEPKVKALKKRKEKKRKRREMMEQEKRMEQEKIEQKERKERKRTEKERRKKERIENEEKEKLASLQNSQRERRNNGLAGVIALVMKADGDTSEKELDAVTKYLENHYKSDYEEIAEAIEINLKINNPNFVKQSCIWLTADMSYAEQLAFVEFLFDIARLSKGIDQSEWELLCDIMYRIGLEDEDIEYMSRKYSPSYSRTGGAKTSDGECGNEVSTNVSSDTSTNPALRVLGLDDSATEEEIQDAYRKLAKKYHPDTVQDEEMKLVLSEKFKEISLAYSTLTK